MAVLLLLLLLLPVIFSARCSIGIGYFCMFVAGADNRPAALPALLQKRVVAAVGDANMRGLKQGDIIQVRVGRGVVGRGGFTGPRGSLLAIVTSVYSAIL